MQPNNIVEKLKAVVLLAGLEYSEVAVLPDRYSGRPDRPYLFFVCPTGTLTIGWRKRVILVEWTMPEVTYTPKPEHEWITHEPPRYFHAYGYAQAVEFLTQALK